MTWYCSQNLEVLVRRQRKAKMYNDVKSGRHRPLYRNEQAMDVEVQRQKMINTDLISTLDSLLTDFPALKFPLMKILNTLQLQPAWFMFYSVQGLCMNSYHFNHRTTW